MTDTPTDQPAAPGPAATDTAGGAAKKTIKSKILHEFRETALTIAGFLPF